MLRVTSEATMVDAVGLRGAVSLRERAEVHVVHVGLGTLKVKPMAREGYALKRGDVLDFAVRLVVHDGDAADADVKGLCRACDAEVLGSRVTWALTTGLRTKA